MDNFNLTNHFLIAMPSLEDPNFARTVTFICVHNDDGALGIVINRPLTVNLAEVFEQMDIACADTSLNAREVYEGGPVHRDRGFILHRPVGDWDSSIQVTPDIAVSTSRDILEAMGSGTGPNENLVALGYAGWGAGQLEFEMSENAWLSGPAQHEIIFSVPANERWRLAAAGMGVDIENLSGDVGHA